MLLTAQCVFLNAEEKAGIKDPNKTYYTVLLMQGAEAVTCMTEAKIFHEVLPSIHQYSSIDCEFDYNVQFKSMRLVGVKPSK